MNADRLARWYRWVEYTAFGGALERRRFAFLDRLKNAQRILVMGEGDGRALERLLAVAPHSEIDVIELSGEMIALARKRIGETNRVRFLQQNALTSTLRPSHYDGVITLFFLDCFSEDDCRFIVRKLAEALAPAALWLVSDFAIPSKGWQRWHAKVWIYVMYRFFAFTTGLRTRALPPIPALLKEVGMERLECAEERFGLIRSAVWVKKA